MMRRGVSKFTTVEVRKSRADSLTPIDPNYDILGTCLLCMWAQFRYDDRQLPLVTVQFQ